jgi:uncharacterized membrane protein YqjE
MVNSEAPKNPGVIKSVRTLLGVCLAVLHSRLELFTQELEEEKRWLTNLLILVFIIVLAGTGAFFCAIALLITLAFMANCLVAVLTTLTIVLGLVFLGVSALVYKKVSTRPRIMSHSLEELRRDIVGLRRSMGETKSGSKA